MLKNSFEENTNWSELGLSRVTGDVLTQPGSQVVLLQYYCLTWYKKSAEQQWWIVRKGLAVQ